MSENRWRIQPRSSYDTTMPLMIVDRKTGLVAEVHGDRNEVEAHANLIVAAPELLIACQAFLALRDDPKVSKQQLDSVVSLASAAVARAIGERGQP